MGELGTTAEHHDMATLMMVALLCAGHGGNSTPRPEDRNLHSADKVDDGPAQGNADGAEHGGVKWYEKGESNGREGPDQQGPRKGVASICVTLLESGQQVSPL